MEGTSPGWCGLKEWGLCMWQRRNKRGDLTEDENLGKGMPAFECWRTEAVRDQRHGCLWFLCLFTEEVNQRVRV